MCLQPGFYFLDQAVRIDGAQSLALEGKGWRTILVSAGREPAIVVQRSIGVAIDSLTVLTSTFTQPGALPTGVAIGLRNTIGTVIERCVLAQLGAVRGGDDGVDAPDYVGVRRGTRNCGRATDRPRRARRRDADPRERARRDDRHRLHLGRHLCADGLEAHGPWHRRPASGGRGRRGRRGLRLRPDVRLHRRGEPRPRVPQRRLARRLFDAASARRGSSGTRCSAPFASGSSATASRCRR